MTPLSTFSVTTTWNYMAPWFNAFWDNLSPYIFPLAGIMLFGFIVTLIFRVFSHK